MVVPVEASAASHREYAPSRDRAAAWAMWLVLVIPEIGTSRTLTEATCRDCAGAWKHPGASLGFLLEPTGPSQSLLGATWGLRGATQVDSR
jgi:hypothetical protein